MTQPSCADCQHYKADPWGNVGCQFYNRCRAGKPLNHKPAWFKPRQRQLAPLKAEKVA